MTTPCERCGDATLDGKSLCFTCASTLGGRTLDEERDPTSAQDDARTMFWPEEGSLPGVLRPGLRASIEDDGELCIVVRHDDASETTFHVAAARVLGVHALRCDVPSRILYGRTFVPGEMFVVVLLADGLAEPRAIYSTTAGATAEAIARWLRAAVARAPIASPYRG